MSYHISMIIVKSKIAVVEAVITLATGSDFLEA